MKTPKWAKILMIIFLVLVSLAVVGYISVGFYIDRHVDQYAAIAQKNFPDERGRIYSMISFMNSSASALKERNDIVWAIGRLSDKRALPYLQALYTGEPCSHSLDLCQYELSKAINRCGGNVDFKYKDKKFNR